MNESRFGIVGGGAIGLAWAAHLLRQGLAVAGVAEADAARRDAGPAADFEHAHIWPQRQGGNGFGYSG